MRNPKRLDTFYDELKYIHKKYCPDWRFGQMMVNVLGKMQSEGRDPFFPEEDRMIRYFEDYFKMTDKDKAEMEAELAPVLEAINDDAYTWSCECPVCHHSNHRGAEEETIICRHCGRKLHVRALTGEELEAARINRELDDWED